MRLKRCSKPGCGNTFNEIMPEFEDGFCSCGAALVEVEQEPEQSVDELLNDQLDGILGKQQNPAEQPIEVVTPVEEVKVTPVVEQRLNFLEQEEIIEVVDEIVGQVPTKDELPTAENETLEVLDVEEEYANEDNSEGDDYHDEDEEHIHEETDDEQQLADDYPAYIIDENNKVIFKEDEQFLAIYKEQEQPEPYKDPYADYEGDCIRLYLDGKVYRTYPLEYDEIEIGREHEGGMPDIDYSKIDTERYISRRHALIYRQQNEYFIRNLSTKNSVHVNKEPLLERQYRCLQDGDKIVLSRKFGLVFKKKSERDLY